MSIKSMANILVSKKESSLESFNYLDQVFFGMIQNWVMNDDTLSSITDQYHPPEPE